MDFLEAVQKRRSIYSLEKSSPISDERIEELLKEAVKNLPSSFNMQSSVPYFCWMKATVCFGIS